MICSVGKHYILLWNRNVDTDNVFEKSIWKYLKMSNITIPSCQIQLQILKKVFK